MDEQVPISSDAIADTGKEEGVREVTPDVGYQRHAVVNNVYVGTPGDRSGGWVLVDTGVIGSTGRIESTAGKRFGKDIPPVAIILTHGHSDHSGTVEALAEKWDVPIYAHTLELPYLDGRASYPPPDTSLGGGIMPKLSPMFGTGPIDVSRWLRVLPDDGSVPGMTGWRWLHTAGHTPGHISLWRESDRTLIAGDAFITTNMESAYAVITQKEELHGPPTPFTTDWPSARRSVEMLAALQPEVVITGHGRAMKGQLMRDALNTLAGDFDRIAIPDKGRYIREPVRADETGPTYIPPEQ
ncbi:MAG: MBL fold metallo-hydrolase [Gemmatimonadaceae bacterium]